MDIPKEVHEEINNQRIEGIDNITDPKLKSDLLAYLYFNGNRKYKELYYYLSKSFLHRFKDIKNADEYAEMMWDTAERGDRKYIKVFNPIYLSEKEVKIKILFEANAEGVEYTFERTEFFIFNGKCWQYEKMEGHKTVED